jgi:hypothetical protein
MEGARPGHSIALKAHRRSDRKPVVIVCDPEHHLLRRFVVHLLGQHAGFFGAPAPVLGIVEMRGILHGRTIAWARISGPEYGAVTGAANLRAERRLISSRARSRRLSARDVGTGTSDHRDGAIPNWGSSWSRSSVSGRPGVGVEMSSGDGV